MSNLDVTTNLQIMWIVMLRLILRLFLNSRLCTIVLLCLILRLCLILPLICLYFNIHLPLLSKLKFTLCPLICSLEGIINILAQYFCGTKQQSIILKRFSKLTDIQMQT
jgi:hypothetical protein